MRSFLLRRMAPVLRPHGKEAFLVGLAPASRVLDVGCGNDSPARAKACAPGIHYTGLDVGDYNQSQHSRSAADDYVICRAPEFAAVIEGFGRRFDAVISSHNIEHCDEPDRVLRGMCACLEPGGRLYLSFPSEASVDFPRRRRSTLNFYDDPTHVRVPRFDDILAVLRSSGMRMEFTERNHRPPIPRIAGALLEPASIAMSRAMPFGTTWALYGFESVIWATRQ